MRQDIAWGGITRSTAEGVCPDGECAELINLVWENGSLRPALEAERVYDFGEHTDRRLVYVHRNQGYENWLSYNGKRLFFEATEENGSVKPSPFVEEGIMDISSLVRIEAIGNTLIVFSGDKKEYLLYKDGNYVYMGEMPPEVEVKFSFQKKTFISDRILCELNPDLPAQQGVENNPPFLEEWTGRQADNIYPVTTVALGAVNTQLAESRKQSAFVFPFFLRYALKLYDESYIYHSPPLFVCFSDAVTCHVPSWSHYNDYKEIANFDIQVVVEGHEIAFSVNYNPGAWINIVKSIEIFASEPVYTYDSNGTIKRFRPLERNSGLYVLDLPVIADDQVKEKLNNSGVFYKVASITLKENKSMYSGVIKLENEGGLDNLIFQERLPDDYNSHCRVTGECSYVYNSKLHIANLRQEFYKGFPVVVTGARGDKCHLQTSFIIKTEKGDAVVSRESESWIYSEDYTLSLPSFIYYPDSRAYRMILTVDNSLIWSVDLSPHQQLNGAYVLLSHTSMGFLINGLPGTFDHTPKNTIVSYPNKMQVSELNNPFTFPVNQIYTIGTGRITGLAAATKALSQGQFGQFPLYVFSEDGIWSMEVGGSAYSVRTPVTRDVCVSPSSVISLDSAVVFASDKGLMVLEGAQVSNLSQVLDGPSFGVESGSPLGKLSELSQGPTLSDIASNCRFPDYLRKATIGYDYVHSRLLVCWNLERYSYVYDLKSGMWSKLSRVYDRVLNAYPECYVSDVKGVYRLSREPGRENGGKMQVCLISRALKLGDAHSLKRLVRLSLLGNEFYSRDLAVTVQGSREGENYSVLKSWKGGRAPRLGGSGFRYFRVMISGSVDVRCALPGIGVEIETLMGNRLR